jgi:predicted aspartyl protease
MAYSHDYSRDYDPVAPVIEIHVRDIERAEPEISIIALIDSGSDATLLPADVIHATRAQYANTRRIRGILGAPSVVDTYMVSIRIGTHTVQAIEAVAVNDVDEAVLGRDVLNQLVIVLNGLAGIVEVEG